MRAVPVVVLLSLVLWPVAAADTADVPCPDVAGEHEECYVFVDVATGTVEVWTEANGLAGLQRELLPGPDGLYQTEDDIQPDARMAGAGPVFPMVVCVPENWNWVCVYLPPGRVCIFAGFLCINAG